MKIRSITLALVAAALVLCLCACSGAKITYNQENGSYTDKKGNVYLRAPSCYEPVSYAADEAVGTLTAGIGEFDLYAVKGAEEGKWLTTADREVLYLESETLPKLQDFGTDRIYICREAEKIHAIHTITQADEIDVLLKAYLEGESIPYPNRVALQSLRLRFASDEYEFLYYKLTYLEFSADVIVYTVDENGRELETNYGKYFIYNRDEERCVPVGDVIHKYVE